MDEAAKPGGGRHGDGARHAAQVPDSESAGGASGSEAEENGRRRRRRRESEEGDEREAMVDFGIRSPQHHWLCAGCFSSIR